MEETQLLIQLCTIDGMIISEQRFHPGDGGQYHVRIPHNTSPAPGLEGFVKVVITGRGVQEAHERISALEKRLDEYAPPRSAVRERKP